MTITIEAPAEVEAAIARNAAREGLPLPEFALRAMIERTGPFESATDPTAETEEAKEARRLAAIAFVKSGYFARTGLSTEDLFAERREDLRLEQLRETGA